MTIATTLGPLGDARRVHRALGSALRPVARTGRLEVRGITNGEAGLYALHYQAASNMPMRAGKTFVFEGG